MAESPHNHPSGPPSTGLDGGRADRAPAEADVRAALDRVLGAEVLRGSERLRRFLRCSVDETLAGRGGRLKEYVVGVEVFERPESFDPRADPVVRVEARRLRAKLAEYYGAEGKGDAVRIDLPKGSYVAVFEWGHGRAPGGGTGAPFDGVAERPTRQPAIVAGAGAAVDAAPPNSAAAPSGAEPPNRRPGRAGGGREGPRRRWLGAVAVAALAVFVAGGIVAVARLWSRPSAAPTVAVLPFANASSDPENQYLCFGLVEDLTTTLAQAPGLRVVARTSAMQFEGGHDIREIGRRLRTDFVVEGSVRREGTQLRITAQLVDARDGSHVWADAYDRDVQNLLATQGEIARAIAGALRARIAPLAAAAAMPIDPDLYGVYLKGKYFVGVVDRQAPEKGLHYLRQVIDRAPGFAPAHAAAAAAYAKLTLDRTVPRAEEIAAAKAAARRALELDPALADAHALRAWMAFFYDWNWDEAERGFQRALTINPNSATASHRYALLLMSTRRFDEALRLSSKAVGLDPLSALVASNRAMILLCARRYDEAIAQARDALELAPGGFTTHVYIGSSLAQQGRYDEAVAAYRAALLAEPGDPDATASLGRALALAGRRSEARAVLQDLRDPARADPPSSYQLAFLLAALGDRDAAFEALERSRVRRETELVYLNVDPLFDQLRHDRRFEAFLDRLGLPH